MKMIEYLDVLFKQKNDMYSLYKKITAVKVKETVFKRFGVKNISQSEEIKNKKKKRV